MRETVQKMAPYIKPSEEHKQIIVNCTKGIEESTLMVMSDVILDEIPGCQVCVLSGPSHAEEVGKGIAVTSGYIIALIMTVLAFYQHRTNIKKLLSGNERKTYIFKKNKVD